MRLLTLVRVALIFGLTLAAFSTIWAAPSPADKSFEVARQFVKLGSDQQAIDELNRFVVAYPSDPRLPKAEFMLGFCFQKEQNYEKALAAYSVVIDKATGDEGIELRADTHLQMAECYRAQKTPDFSKAAQSYNNFLLLSSRVDLTKKAAGAVKTWQTNIVYAHYWRAESLYQLGQGHADDALREYQQVMALAPADPLAPWACYMIGVLDIKQTHFSDAITDLGLIPKNYADSEVAGETALELGVAYAGRAHAEKGPAQRTDYLQAAGQLTATLDSSSVTLSTKEDAALLLAGVYSEQQDYANAEATYARALSLMDDPTSQRAMQTHLQRGHVLFNAKRYQDAAMEYARVTAGRKYPELVAEALYWQANCAFMQATAADDAQQYHETIALLTRFLAPPGDKDERAPQAALLQAYCYEDLASRLSEKDAAKKAADAFTLIITQWPGSPQAVQARAGISRLTPTLTTTDLKNLDIALPPGAASWDVGLQLAYKEFQAGQYEAAVTSATQVLNGKPVGRIMAQAAYLVAASLHKQGHVTDALLYYQQVLSCDPGGDLEPFARRALAQAYLDAKDYPNALTAAQKLLLLPAQGANDADRANDRAERMMYLAAAYLGLKQYDDAQATYRRVVTETPKSPLAPNALMNIAQVADMRNDRKMAIDTYREFIRTFPDRDDLVPTAYFRLGVNLNAQKDYEEAVVTFLNVPASSKLADQAAYATAWAYYDSGNPEQAEKQFKLVTEKFPDSPLAADSWYRLGESDLQRQDYAGAAQQYTHALALNKDPDMAAVIAHQLGTCAFDAGQYAQAADAYQTIVTNYPTSQYADDSLFWMAAAWEKVGTTKDSDARDAYLQYVAKYPAGEYVADAALGAGRAAMATKQYSIAREDLTKAFALFDKLEKGPDSKLADRAKSLSAETQFTVAQSYLEEKNYEQAIREFAAVSMFIYEPWYSRSHVEMARCSALIGDKDTATAKLKWVLTTFPNSEAAKEAKDVAKEFGLTIE